MKMKSSWNKIKYITNCMLLLMFILLEPAYSQIRSNLLSIEGLKKIYTLKKDNDFNTAITLINKKKINITLPFVFTSAKYINEYIVHTDYVIFYKNRDEHNFKKIKDGPFMRSSEVGKSISFSSYKKDVFVYIPKYFLSEIGIYKIKFTIDFYKNGSKKIYKTSSNLVNLEIK